MLNEETIRVLIIDDNPAIHEDIRKIFSQDSNSSETIFSLEAVLFGKPQVTQGLPAIKIDSAYQGEEGYDLVKAAKENNQPYALAIVDMRMPPGWHGVETLLHLWELDEDMQAVVCTAFSDYSWTATIKRLGITDRYLILKKPFEVIEIRQMIYALIQKWKMQIQVKSKFKFLENKLSHQATHDMLTGLPNRLLLIDRMELAITNCKLTHFHAALLYIDLDRFNLINHSFGTDAGDNCLKDIAKRLGNCLSKHNTIVRIGGDEFIILLPSIAKPEDIIPIAQKCINAICKPIQIKGNECRINCSVGISVYPKDGQDIDTLLNNAEAAMFRVKERSVSNLEFYTEEMNSRVQERLMLEMSLRAAVEQNELLLYYQPLINLSQNEIFGFEALLRWRHPTLGTIILPEEFVPLAEEIGLIVPISEWVLREACIQYKQWRDLGFDNLRLSFNLSPHHLEQPDVVANIQQIISESQFPPTLLDLEITEGILIENQEHITSILREIKMWGIQLVIDDFGVGYSSLSYLSRFPIDKIKIDKSFVNHISFDPGDTAILSAILMMAKAMNLKVLAEGVETEAQLNYLRSNQCDEVQGYLFGRPMPAAGCLQLLQARRK